MITKLTKKMQTKIPKALLVEIKKKTQNITACVLVIIDDEQYSIVYASKTDYLLEYDEAELIGDPLENLLPPEIKPHHRALMERFKKGSVASIEPMAQNRDVNCISKSGQKVSVNIEIAYFNSTSDKEPGLFIALIQDARNKKMSREDIYQAKAELGDVVLKGVSHLRNKFNQRLKTVGIGGIISAMILQISPIAVELRKLWVNLANIGKPAINQTVIVESIDLEDRIKILPQVRDYLRDRASRSIEAVGLFELVNRVGIGEQLKYISDSKGITTNEVWFKDVDSDLDLYGKKTNPLIMTDEERSRLFLNDCLTVSRAAYRPTTEGNIYYDVVYCVANQNMIDKEYGLRVLKPTKIVIAVTIPEGLDSKRQNAFASELYSLIGNFVPLN